MRKKKTKNEETAKGKRKTETKQNPFVLHNLETRLNTMVTSMKVLFLQRCH